MAEWKWRVVDWRTKLITDRELGRGDRNPKRPIATRVPFHFEVTCPAGHTAVIRGRRARGAWELKCPTCGDLEYVTGIAIEQSEQESP